MTTPGIQRRWKALPGEPVGDAGDPYTGYDRFGRTEAMRWIKPVDGGFNTLVNVQWGYSPASQKTWRKDLLAPASAQQDQHFQYDGLQQVTERQRGVLNVNATAAGGIPAQQENFSYDETGNWQAYRQSNSGALSIDQSRVNNRSNQITQVDGSSAGVSYDPNGNMLTVPTGEDLTSPGRRIVWDGWNRPVKVYDADDNLIAEYRYDGLGRRITVTSAGTTRHIYYDDQWRSIEERLDASTTAERQHVWQPNNRWEMILRDRSTVNNGTMDERLYPMKDQLDPVAVCDASGNVVERYAYTAFGLPTFLDASFSPESSSLAWNFLFHAEFQDADTGWFNYGYRYYIPTLGRWPSRDPIGIKGGLNLYRMVGNDVLNNYDLLGQKVENFVPDNFGNNKNDQVINELQGKTFTAKCGCEVDFNITTAKFRPANPPYYTMLLSMTIDPKDNKMKCDRFRIIQFARSTEPDFKRASNQLGRGGRSTTNHPSDPTAEGWHVDSGLLGHGSLPSAGYPFFDDSPFAELLELNQQRRYYDTPAEKVGRGFEAYTCVACEKAGSVTIIGCLHWGFKVDNYLPKGKRDRIPQATLMPGSGNTVCPDGKNFISGMTLDAIKTWNSVEKIKVNFSK